jgi:uncharacterized protein (DUF305 family)
MRVHRSWLTAVAITAFLAGCGGDSKQDDPAAPGAEATTAEVQATVEPGVKVVQPGAPGEESKEVVPTPTPKGGAFVPADVEFMQQMIEHHAQALVMTALVPTNGANTSLRVMAKRMEVSQQDETELMKRWLKARNFKDTAEHADHTSMPGMLTDAQLAELKAAKGKAFDALFLKFMTQHHEGALEMVRKLQMDGGGQEVEIGQFMLHVESDQAIEIEKMAELSEKL